MYRCVGKGKNSHASCYSLGRAEEGGEGISALRRASKGREETVSVRYPFNATCFYNLSHMSSGYYIGGWMVRWVLALFQLLMTDAEY